jgi:hypothetical protein
MNNEYLYLKKNRVAAQCIVYTVKLFRLAFDSSSTTERR